jgi:cobalt-zinc-cadmium efflux system protein
VSTITEQATLSHRRERRLLLALGLNIGIVVGQVIAGVVAHSLGLIADAAHNVTDATALGLSAYAVRMSRRPANAQRSYGFHRSTVLAAQANAAGILVVTGFVAVEAVRRFADPGVVTGKVVLIVALGAAAANATAMLSLSERHLHDHAPNRAADLGVRSAMIHLAGDTVASIGVAIAGAMILITHGTYWLDPAVSLAIGAAIAWQGWRLLRDTTAVLMEGSPAGLDVAALTSTIESLQGVDEVHDLHVWSLSSNVNALSAHLVLAGQPSLEQAQRISVNAKAAISAPFAIAHATFELESATCRDDGSWCTMHADHASVHGDDELNGHDHDH